MFLNNTPPNVNAGSDRTLTCSITSLMLYGYSSTPGATFSWATSDGNIVSGGTTSNPIVNAAGTYTLTVTNPVNGCTAQDQVQVFLINTPPVGNLGNDTTATFCKGYITLDAGNQGMSFLWSTGATTQTINVSTTGTYSVVVTNSYGCTGYDVINVTINPGILIVDLGNDTVIVACDPVSLLLDAGNPGAYYSWSTGATTQTILVSSSGTYYVDVTDTKGCTASDTIKVSISGAIDLDFGPDTTVCECILLNAYTSGATSYLWCSGGTYPDKTVCETGLYCVTVTNGLCTESDTIFVTVDPPIVVDLGNDTTVMTSVILDAGNPGAMFLWNTGETTQTIVAGELGQYIVVVTGANGCTGTDTINVNVLSGIGENTQANFHLNAYPNPSNNSSFTLSFEIAERGNVEIRILSTLGVIVYFEKLENFQGEYVRKITSENLAAGIYVADILKGNMRSTVKIVLE